MTSSQRQRRRNLKKFKKIKKKLKKNRSSSKRRCTRSKMWRGAKTTEAQLIGRGGTETLRRNCSKVLVVYYFTTLLLYYFTTLLRGGMETLRRNCSKALALLRYLLYEYKSTNTDSEETARRPGPVGNRVRSCLARNSLGYSKKKLKKLKK
jgi:hypothetical protein